MNQAIEKLRSLRRKAAEINATIVDDLKPFYLPDHHRFRRLPNSDDEGNVTNTCSCLMALANSEKLNEFFGRVLGLKKQTEIDQKITTIFEIAVQSEWMSSGLDDNNAFTALIVLRTGGILSAHITTKPILNLAHPSYDNNKAKTGVSRTLNQVATDFLNDFPNTLRVDKYPANPGLAYWFVDALDQVKDDVAEDRWEEIARWSSETFARQLSLVSAHHDAMKDPVAMALAAGLAMRLHRIITEGAFTKRDQIIDRLPTKIEIEQALLVSLSFQEPSGIWPKYFPLFNYKKEGVGSNYLFSFEVLEGVIHEFKDSKIIEDGKMLKALERALDWCQSNRLTYKLNNKTYEGWNSGGQITTLREGQPEAWATAVVHMFLSELRHALSALIRTHVLAKYDATLPSDEAMRSWKSWEELLDSPLEISEKPSSAKAELEKHIMNPVRESGSLIDQRRRSALLFGPPGTAKTSLVRAIAKEIEWPLVELNPSHFLKRSLENIYSQADEVFKDLNDLSAAIVFFDEMDALAQRRVEGVDVTRQFLTTSMLPKLSELHDSERVLFFMATNHLRSFDEAITRPGRFDILLHIRPPLWRDKVEHIDSVWPGRKRRDLETTWPPDKRTEDAEAVKARLKSWVPTDTGGWRFLKARTNHVVEILNRFTPGELESFLETIGEGPTLKTEIEKMSKRDFISKIESWGSKYIGLHSGSLPKVTSDSSLLAEFELDKGSSRL